jgi:uncharacterized protein (DUF305 family)
MKPIPMPVKLPVLLLAFAGLPLLPLTIVASEPAPTRSVERFEVRFLTDMIHHHAMGVAMAEICLEKEVRPELEALCHTIAETQAAEIEVMEGWLSDWYGLEPEIKPKPGHQKAMERLAKLSREEFEIAFLKMMIRHHAGAVRASSRCEDKAHHEELIELCHSIVESQSGEIELMETWLKEWYGTRL